ncbi:putative ribonuclease H protein [Glycine soja]
MDKLVRVQRRFLWGRAVDHNKIAWVKWDTVCLPKEEGGLGIKDINTFNLALLAKWKWSLFQQQGDLWARVLESKYGGWRSLDEVTSTTNESIWWRDLKRVFQHPDYGEALSRSIVWRVGCGDNIKFWEDQWIGEDRSLAVKYPRLYLISSQQNHTIQQMGACKDTGWEWELSWRRLLFDNEIDMAVAFLNDVESKQIQLHRKDEWVWTADPSGHYSARSAYIIMRESIAEGAEFSAFEELWKLKVPNKVLAFAWRLLRDRLPTRANLHRRQVEINDRKCLFCGNVEESASHLFFHCSKISPLWWESMSWVNSVGPLPQSPKHHFLQHIFGVVEAVKVNRWKCWWIALTWSIWQHRNKILFSNVTLNANKIMDDAVFLLWTWLRNLEKDFGTGYNHWSSNLRLGFGSYLDYIKSDLEPNACHHLL